MLTLAYQARHRGVLQASGLPAGIRRSRMWGDEMTREEVMTDADFNEMMAERETAWLIHDGKLDARADIEQGEVEV